MLIFTVFFKIKKKILGNLTGLFDLNLSRELPSIYIIHMLLTSYEKSTLPTVSA